MTTATLGGQAPSFNLRFLFVLFVIAIVIAAVGAAPLIHADVRHGVDATAARQCLNGKQHTYLFHNAASNRYGTVCEIEGVWGVVITDEFGREITSFLKNKMKTFNQVLKYMRNAGYDLVH